MDKLPRLDKGRKDPWNSSTAEMRKFEELQRARARKRKASVQRERKLSEAL